MQEELKVKISSDSSSFRKGIKAAGRALDGLKNAASNFGLGKAVKQAEKELSLLERTLAMNQRKLAEYQQKAAKLRLFLANPPGVNTSKEKAELDSLVAKLDNINAQIEERRKRLQQIKAAHTGPGGETLQMSPKSTKEYLKIESELVRLIGTSDKAVVSIAKLEDRISALQMEDPSVVKAKEDLRRTEEAILRLERSSAAAEKKARGLKDSLEQAGRSGKAAAKKIIETGAASKVISKAAKPFTEMSKAINMAIRRVLVLGVAYKLVRGATKYLTDALKTNQQFAASLNAIKVNLAVAFQPIYDAVLPALNALMSMLAKITSYVAAFTSMLFGKTYAQSKQAAKGLDAAKTAMGGYGGAAEEAKGQLAAFDKFNDITPQKSGGGGGGGGGGLAFDDVEEPKNLAAVQKVIDNLNRLLEPTKKSLAGLKKELNRLKGFALLGLIDFYERFLRPVGKWTFGEGLPRFIDALTKGLAKVSWQRINDSLAKLWDALAPFAINVGEGLLWLWEKVLVPLGTWTLNEVVPRFLDLLSGALTVLNTVIDVIKPGVKYLFNNFLKPIAVWTGGKIIDILDLLGETFVRISKWFKDHSKEINAALQSIGDLLSAVWSNLLRPTLDALWGLFKTTFRGISSLVGEVIPGVIQILTGLCTFLTGVFTGDWKKAWEGIKTIFKGIWNSIVAIVEGAINLLITGINSLIKKVNDAIKKMNGVLPIAVPALPVISKISLPRLAKGALAYGELTAVIGDNFNARQDPEVVSPLSRLQEMITGAILQRDISGGGSNVIELKMTLENGEPLVHALIDPMNKIAKNQGYAPVFKPVGVV